MVELGDYFAVAIETCYWKDESEECNKEECPYYSSWEACQAVKFLVNKIWEENE